MPHAARQPWSWLIFDVRQKMKAFVPLISVAAITTTHFLAFLYFVALAVGADAQGETLTEWQSSAIGILGMPLMPISRFAGGTTEVVALAIATSMLWAVCLTGAFLIWRHWRLRSHHKTA